MSEERGGSMLWTALVLSIMALAGSLYLSMGMGLKACPLCLYQRTFVMAVVGVLGIGVFSRPRGLPLLALPLAVGGLCVALFHVYLEATGKLECPRGVLATGSAPQQSLVVLALLFLVLLGAAMRDSAEVPRLGIPLALVLGVLFSVGAVLSAPPSPRPQQEYSTPVDRDGCRPPYRAP